MKQTIHATLCHPKLVDKPTLSCRACRDISIQLKILLFSIFFLLFSFSSTAQNYDWKWAISGGGVLGADQIYDVKVGSDNHYYFIGSMHGTIGVQLDGYSVDVYNSSLGGDDIFLFSTDCDGQVLWSQAIGGAEDDVSYNLALDSNNNVYVGVYVTGGSNYSIHFSPDPAHDVTPFPANLEAYKRIYLVKYNSNGQYQGRKALQGSVDNTSNQSQILDLFIDNTNTIHFIVGLRPGTHLDNNVTVPTTVTGFQYFLAKYDTNLNYISSMLLPITDGTGFNNDLNPVRFAYDKTLNRYFLATTRETLTPFTYNSKTVQNRSFILAFNGTNGGLEWLREIYSQPINGVSIQTNRIYSLVVDENSDIYIGGNIYKSPNETNLKIYDPTDAAVAPYLFTPGADFTIPMIAKLNNSGTVQWVQATAAYSSGVLGPAPRYGNGIAINGNEVAFGAQGGGDFWDAIEIVRPIINYQPDPLLIRFNKQTGAVINVHEIKGEAISTKQMTAVAADNDGNYITGGIFNSNLFMNNTMGITPLVSAGDFDFFVAKLAASVCGTPVSTDKFNKLSVNVYPNPTNGIVTIETTETLSSYIVYDMQGRRVQNGLFSNDNQVNLQSVATGTYFIQVHTVQGSTATVKVVKE